MEATVQDVQQEIVDEFSAFDDWMDKYEYLRAGQIIAGDR